MQIEQYYVERKIYDKNNNEVSLESGSLEGDSVDDYKLESMSDFVDNVSYEANRHINSVDKLHSIQYLTGSKSNIVTGAVITIIFKY